MLTPTVRRPWPAGEDADAAGLRLAGPAVRHQCHYRPSGGWRPGLYFDLLDDNTRAEDVVAFVKELHRRLRPLTVLWDRKPDPRPVEGGEEVAGPPPGYKGQQFARVGICDPYPRQPTT